MLRFFFQIFQMVCVRSIQNTTGEVCPSSQMERSPNWPWINGPLRLGLTLTMSLQLQFSFFTSQSHAVKTAQAHGVLHIIFNFTGITCSLKKMQSINNHKGKIFLNLPFRQEQIFFYFHQNGVAIAHSVLHPIIFLNNILWTAFHIIKFSSTL